MADRVKYFLLGVLFLVVAGVIAYDRWNTGAADSHLADDPNEDTGTEIELAVRNDPPKAATAPPEDGQPKATPESKQEPAPASGNRQPAPLHDLTGPVAPRSEPKNEPKSPPKVEPKPEPKPEPDRTHVIRKGETLEAIAIRYYGTRDGIPWIVNANGLPNANRIYANQKLVIPARKEITKERGSGDGGAAKSAGKSHGSRYTVKQGDGDLYAICQRLYGSAQPAQVTRIMELNQLWSANVKAGTVLILPPK